MIEPVCLTVGFTVFNGTRLVASGYETVETSDYEEAEKKVRARVEGEHPGARVLTYEYYNFWR